MAVNFFDSAGSDLDNLFSANNSNAGALGYLTSGNQDLGNRYFKGSLNRTIGYYNSAGSDIGYQRGKIIAPTATASIAVQHYKDQGTLCRHDGGRYHYCGWYWLSCDSNGESCSRNERLFNRGLLTLSVSVTNGMPITGIDWYLNIQERNSDMSYPYTDTLYLNVNSSTVPTSIEKSYGFSNYSSTQALKFTAQYQWLRTNKLITTTNTTLKIGFSVSNKITRNWWGYWAKARVYVKNSAGGIWLNSAKYIKLGGFHNT